MAENDGRPFSPSIAASTPGAIEDADNGSQSSDQGEVCMKSSSLSFFFLSFDRLVAFLRLHPLFCFLCKCTMHMLTRALYMGYAAIGFFLQAPHVLNGCHLWVHGSHRSKK